MSLTTHAHERAHTQRHIHTIVGCLKIASKKIIISKFLNLYKPWIYFSFFQCFFKTCDTLLYFPGSGGFSACVFVCVSLRGEWGCEVVQLF